MPKLNHVRRFLHRNGWVMASNTDHEYYKKILPDGEILRTCLSHGNGEIPPSVRRKMKKQMRITDEDFNAGLK